MRARENDWHHLTLLFLILILLLFCKKQEAPLLEEKAAQADSARSNVPELRLDSQSEIEQSLDRILKLIKAKEAELMKAQQEINHKSAELRQQEEQLARIEIKMKNFRNYSYFVLGVGLVLILIGLYLIFFKPKSEPH